MRILSLVLVGAAAAGSQEGAVVSDRLESLDFADPELADPGLLGDSIYRLIVTSIEAAQRSPPPLVPGAL